MNYAALMRGCTGGLQMFYADAHCDTLYALAVEHKPAHTLDITVDLSLIHI